MDGVRRCGRLVMYLGIAIWAFGMLSAETQANLIRNPGLDNGANQTIGGEDFAVITQWTNVGEVMYVSDDGHDAPGCAQIDWSTGKLRQVGIPVTGGQIYTFSYWTKYIVGRWGSTNGAANVYLQYYDAGGNNVGLNNLAILPPTNGTWVQASATWTIPATATEAQIWSAGVGSNGGIRIDDFSLVPEPSLPALLACGALYGLPRRQLRKVR